MMETLPCFLCCLRRKDEEKKMSNAADTATTISQLMTMTMTTSANEILQVLPARKTNIRNQLLPTKQSTKPESEWAQCPTSNLLLDFIIETFVSKAKQHQNFQSIISSNISIASSEGRDGSNLLL